MAIDPASLDALFPSLLVFAEIAFALLLAIPTAKMSVKGHLDKLYTQQKKIKASSFIFWDFYLNFSTHLYIYAFLYLISILFILLSPITDFQKPLLFLGWGGSLKMLTLYFIVIITVMVIVTAICAIADSIVKALHVSEIPTTILDNI